MTAFHYRAILLSVQRSIARYEYCPDHIVEQSSLGVFEVDLSTGDFKIVEAAPEQSSRTVIPDEARCALLVRKILAAYRQTGEPPAAAYWIA